MRSNLLCLVVAAILSKGVEKSLPVHHSCAIAIMLKNVLTAWEVAKPTSEKMHLDGDEALGSKS